ncbi:MAG: carboxymuconolactone decarboxylase family protein [Acidobacteriota bacterium]
MIFQIHDLNTAPAGSRETLSMIAQNYGFLPNLAGVFAESPAVLRGLLGTISAFDAKEMTLSPIERQVVLLAVSVKNRCEYCTAAHSMLTNKLGIDRNEIENLQQGRRLTDQRLEILRHFAEEILDRRGLVTDSELELFLNSGFTKAQILEVIFGIAIKTLTNYANHIANPPVNEQFAGFQPNWANAEVRFL